VVAIKLKTADWDDSAGTHNALAAESAYLYSNIIAEFNRPARATIVLMDPDGSIAQKYDVDAAGDSVYIGPGRAYLYDDDDAGDASLFDGRIVRAVPDMEHHRLTLECEDWLSQLNDRRIDYDMREDLDSDNDMGEQGIRQSTLAADPDNATYIHCAYTSGADYYAYDDGRSWNADEFNGMYLLISSDVAGTHSFNTGPYDGACSASAGAGDFQDLDYGATWTDDGNAYAAWDNDEDWTSDFYFRMMAGNNAVSDWYLDGSITGARIRLSYSFKDSTPDATCALQVYDNNAAAYVSIADLPTYNSARGVIITKQTFEVPEQYVPYFISDVGLGKVRFNVTRGSGTAYLYVYYIRIEVDVSSCGYSSTISIIDTLDLNGHGGKVNCLKIGNDLRYTAATIAWEGIPYCIGKPIHKHLSTGQGGTLVTDADTIYAMTANANIEATAGISTRHYIERTVLEILQDLSTQDKAVFYVPLGSVDLTWKSTFNNGAPTAITDASVLAWKGDWNYESMFNEYIVHGARIGNYDIEQTDSDATSLATYGIYKTRVVKNTGILNEYDCIQLADKLVTRDKDVHLYLEAVLPGLSSLRLGDEVSITSTYLSLAAQVYTITHWAFDSMNYRTHIRLYPRASTIGYQENMTFNRVRDNIESQKTAQIDRYIPGLTTQEWT
jgi:hypothetical protein